MCFAMGFFPVSSAHRLLVITEYKTIVGKARGPYDMSHDREPLLPSACAIRKR
jgi:hypothetical protein